MRWLGVVLLVVLVALAGGARAQEVSRGSHPAGAARFGGFGFFMGGVQWIDAGALNDALTARGFAGVSSPSVSLGGGGYFRLDRFLVGGHGQFLLGGSSQRGSRVTETSGGYGMFDLGYVLIDGGDLWVFPAVGLGGGGMGLTLSTPEAPASFAAALDDPRRETTLETGGFLVEVGAGADFLVLKGEDAEGEGGWLVGLRAGYLFAPGFSGWSFHGSDVPGGPDLTPAGPFVRLVIGGGGTSFR